MGYKYFLFDLDGTLTEPKEGIVNSMQYALRYYGIEVSNESLVQYIGPPLINTFMDGFGFDEVKALQAVDKYREYFSQKGIFENDVYDGIINCLDELVKNDKVLMVATSKPQVFAKQILEHFELLKYFTFVSGSELDGTRNKKSEVIEYALKKIDELEHGKLNLSDVVMIGDRKYDIEGAREMGIDSIAVLYGYGDIKEMQSVNAQNIINEPKELIKYI